MNIKLPRRIDKRITEEYGAYLAPNRGKERVLYVPQAMFEKTMYALTYQIICIQEIMEVFLYRII